MRDAEILERLAAPRTVRDLRDAAVLTLLRHGITPTEVSRLLRKHLVGVRAGYYAVDLGGSPRRVTHVLCDMAGTVRLMRYLAAFRCDEDSPLFTGRDGKAISAHQVNSIRRRLRRKVR